MPSNFLISAHELHKSPVLAKMDGGKVPKRTIKRVEKENHHHLTSTAHKNMCFRCSAVNTEYSTPLHPLQVKLFSTGKE